MIHEYGGIQRDNTRLDNTNTDINTNLNTMRNTKPDITPDIDTNNYTRVIKLYQKVTIIC